MKNIYNIKKMPVWVIVSLCALSLVLVVGLVSTIANVATPPDDVDGSVTPGDTNDPTQTPGGDDALMPGKCTHTNTQIRYEKVDADKHNYWTECAACGEVTNGKKVSAHDYNTSGACACGAKCVHDRKGGTVVSNKTYLSHTYSAHCLSCGMALDAREEAHTFVDSRCTVCDYICRHDAADSGVVWQVIATNTMNGHEASGVCTNCQFDSTGSVVVEPHDYDENGRCTICGHSCVHASDVVNYTPINAKLGGVGDAVFVGQHKKMMNCPDCLRAAEVTSECDLDSMTGICELCNGVCPHRTVNTIYSNKTETTHDSHETCVLCKNVVVKTAVEHTWNDGICVICEKVCAHNWSNGVCTICKKTCTHNWSNGVCTICETACSHIDYDNGVCVNCHSVCNHASFTQTADYKSEFDFTAGTLTVLRSLTCSHCGRVTEYSTSGAGSVVIPQVLSSADLNRRDLTIFTYEGMTWRELLNLENIGFGYTNGTKDGVYVEYLVTNPTSSGQVQVVRADGALVTKHTTVLGHSYALSWENRTDAVS